MMSDSNSPDLNPLDYQVREQCWSRTTSRNRIKPKTVPEFKGALQLTRSALPEKAIENAVKDYRKRLQTRVSANGGHFEHNVIIHKTSRNCYM